MSVKRAFVILLCLCVCLSACVPVIESEPKPGPVVKAPTVTIQYTETSQSNLVQTDTPTSIPSATQTEKPSSTPVPSETVTIEPSASPVPTYAILRGVVIPDKVSCRYGPGAMYLYLYGMVAGATQDIIGRTDSGKWVLTRSHGDNKACWVKSEYLNIKGDVMSVEMVYPDKFKLPPSNQGYRSPWDVAAIRKGNDVTISWKSDPLRAGDEESATSVLYVVETWICQGGQLIFTPIGAYSPQVTIRDEVGCKEPSHGRVFFSEKHGYAGPTEINWPQAR
jgi:uncharacterized protein YceK